MIHLMSPEQPEVFDRLHKLVLKKSTDYLHRDADKYMRMVLEHGVLYVFDECIIVVRHEKDEPCSAWLFFEKFNRNVVRAMAEVSQKLAETEHVLVSTQDQRIVRILQKMKYRVILQKCGEYYMIRRRYVRDTFD